MRNLIFAVLLLAAPAAASFEDSAAQDLASLALEASQVAQSSTQTVDTDQIASASAEQGPCEVNDPPPYCVLMYDTSLRWRSMRNQRVPGAPRVPAADGTCPEAPKRHWYWLADPYSERMTTLLKLSLKDGTTRVWPLAVRGVCGPLETLLQLEPALSKLISAVETAVAQSSVNFVNQYAFCYRKVTLLTPLAKGEPPLRLETRTQPLACDSIDLAAAVYEEHSSKAAAALQCSVTCRYRDPVGTLTTTILTGSGTDAGKALKSLEYRCSTLGMMSDNEVLSASCR